MRYWVQFLQHSTGYMLNHYAESNNGADWS